MLRRTLVFFMSLFVAISTQTIWADEVSGDVVKVFILAGQSNMEGKAQLPLLQHQITAPETKGIFAHLHRDGEFIVRDDVWIKFLGRKGRLTVGYGSPKRCGVELEFGFTVGDHYDEPVLIIKTAWGGKSLFRDFRPPSSGMPDASVLADDLERARKRRPSTSEQEVRESYGKYYRLMISDVQDTLENLGTHFPELKNKKPELAGFVWFQGFNDMINEQYSAAYPKHMANFIRDVRQELQAPQLPFVIGQLGVGGDRDNDSDSRREQFKANQIAPAKLPEFRDNVLVVKTDQYWDWEAQAVFDKGWRNHIDEWNRVGSDYPYHYLGSHKCYGRIGRAFAETLINDASSEK
ncbi:sialate O-acetylesterase [Thalassoroseus pseudoceratinae]|uniref:sialate O-acetylesterase n=1 Tax=Thalassoroseus pseudoceratinae TaxID=2713176 RepID=UPI00141DC050|nr:sialate O-acetylesterase [Thalassoroseus pseudoceratinae]